MTEAQKQRLVKLSKQAVSRVREYDGPFHDSPDHWSLIIKYLENPFFYISCDGYKIDHTSANHFSRGGVINHPLTKLDQYPVCWPLPKPHTQPDWLEVCGVPKNEPTSNPDLSPAAVAKRILKTKTQNRKLKKTEIKAIVVPSLSVRQFGSAWDMAKQENPSIGKPGRKKS